MDVPWGEADFFYRVIGKLPEMPKLPRSPKLVTKTNATNCRMLDRKPRFYKSAESIEKPQDGTGGTQVKGGISPN